MRSAVLRQIIRIIIFSTAFKAIYAQEKQEVKEYWSQEARQELQLSLDLIVLVFEGSCLWKTVMKIAILSESFSSYIFVLRSVDQTLWWYITWKMKNDDETVVVSWKTCSFSDVISLNTWNTCYISYVYVVLIPRQGINLMTSVISVLHSEIAICVRGMTLIVFVLIRLRAVSWQQQNNITNRYYSVWWVSRVFRE